MTGAGPTGDRGGRSPLERDDAARRAIRAELDDHVARRARSLEAGGLSPAAARAEALRRLGDAGRIEEELMRIVERRRRRNALARWFDEFVGDVRLAMRGARRRPVLSAGIVLTVALAIGATAAVFGIVNAVVLRPLAFPRSGDLYSVYSRYLPETGYDFEFFTISGPELDDYRAMTRAMSGIAAYGTGMANLAPVGGEPERVLIVAGTANLLDVLGVAPARGRGFEPGSDDPGRACVTVLSDGLWRERFGAAPGVVGSDVHLDGRPCRVIGVMPRGYWFPVERVRLWTTLELDRASPDWVRGSHPFVAIARLEPGSSRTAAQAELDALRARWSDDWPDHHARGHFLVLQPLLDDLVGAARPALFVLFGAVAAVLLVVCVNLAGLLLSAAESRRREFAVRAALGVGRGRLVRQVLTESLAFAVLGGVLGLLVSGPILRGVLRLYPGGLPRGSEVGIDAVALAFTLLTALFAGLLIGLVPALQTSSVRVSEVLRAAGRGITLGPAGVRARRVFVVAQTALALVLVVAATLLAQSYARLRAVDLGFDAADVLTFNVTVPSSTRPDPAAARDYFARLEQRLAAIPGVEAAGALSSLPLRSAGGADDFIIEGRATPAPGELQWNARYQMATPSALPALRLRLLHGRWFLPTDRAGAPPVAVINQATAGLYFPGLDPVGRRIRYFGPDSAWITIVGIVADVRSLAVDEAAPPAVFTALAQAPRPAYTGRSMNLVVRFRADPAAGAARVRAAVAAIDASLPPSELTTLDRLVTEAVGRPRFTLTLMSIFAALALVLGALGLYAVLAHSVQRRLHEIGIRLALGARPAHLLAMVVRQGLALVVIGTFIGLAAAFALRTAIARLLFGVTPLDPATLALAALTLLTCSLAASLIPALRATRVDPNVALRSE